MIRIAILGAGRWGPNFIRNFHNHQHSEVARVVDPDESRLGHVRRSFPDVELSTSADDALHDPHVDAVVIATPTATHHALARAALNAGKHVLVEKPICNNSDDAMELCRLAQATGRILMVGHIFIYNSAIQWVKAYLDQGHLGRIYYVSMVRTNLGPIRPDVDAAWDLAPHDLSIVNYWLGAEPVSVSALGGAWINAGLSDAMFATLRYPNHVLVNLHVSWLNPRKARDITVVGDHRMLTVDDMNILEPVRVYDKQVTEEISYVDSFASFRASVRDGDITIPRITTGEPLRTECDHFIECIRSGRAPLTGGSDGMAVVRALEAIERSARNRGVEEPIEPCPVFR